MRMQHEEMRSDHAPVRVIRHVSLLCVDKLQQSCMPEGKYTWSIRHAAGRLTGSLLDCAPAVGSHELANTLRCMPHAIASSCLQLQQGLPKLQGDILALKRQLAGYVNASAQPLYLVSTPGLLHYQGDE